MYSLNQHLIYDAASLTARIHRSRNQAVEVGVTPLTITPGDLLAKFLFPLTETLCSASLEVLDPNGGMLPPGNTTMIPMN